uniref:Uncharacterized protein n=1 Tax=viral metagenome TaxID=1070528 RepID=A0A6C0F425_9ZZZZ
MSYYPTTYGSTNYGPTYGSTNYGTSQSDTKPLRCSGDINSLKEKLGRKTKKRIEKYDNIKLKISGKGCDSYPPNEKNKSLCENLKKEKHDAVKELFQRSKKKSKKFIKKVLSNPTDENLNKFSCYLTLLFNTYQLCGVSTPTVNNFIDTFIKSNTTTASESSIYINYILKDYKNNTASNEFIKKNKKTDYETKLESQIDAYTEPTTCR